MSIDVPTQLIAPRQTLSQLPWIHTKMKKNPQKLHNFHINLPGWGDCILKSICSLSCHHRALNTFTGVDSLAPSQDSTSAIPSCQRLSLNLLVIVVRLFSTLPAHLWTHWQPPQQQAVGTSAACLWPPAAAWLFKRYRKNFEDPRQFGITPDVEDRGLKVVFVGVLYTVELLGVLDGWWFSIWVGVIKLGVGLN